METKGIAPATPATERRQRTPLAVTRERVLGIAEQMFRQSGVQAVSVDAIAQAAGIKKMTLYRCFPSKEELVMACMDQWEAAFRRIWDQAQDQYPNESARQLLAFFQSIYELVSQPEYSGNVFMHLMTDYTDPEHHICVRVREQRASLRADVRNQLVKAEASDPDQLADTYCLLLEGLFTAARTHGFDSGPVRNAPAIAERLCIAPSTVKTHLVHLYRKADVADRQELLRKLEESSSASGSPSDRFDDASSGRPASRP